LETPFNDLIGTLRDQAIAGIKKQAERGASKPALHDFAIRF
jgi:hypothetical protein